MNLFKLKTTWTTSESGLLKICLLSVGILIGTRFHDFFYEHIHILVAIAAILVIWAFGLWAKKARTGADD